MKKIISLTLLLAIAGTSLAQKNSNSLLISAGKSWHGTGDLNGIIAEVAYAHKFKKRLELSAGFTTTINYGKDRGFNGFMANASPDERLLRFTAAGIQLTPVLNFAILYTPAFQIKIGAGPIARFQSSSFPQVYGYYQDTAYFPLPFYTFYDNGKQNTFTAGYTVGATINVCLSKNYETGLKTFFQNDTNGDVITSISLIIGKVL
ncbi:MAG: hypothetical protein ABI691_16040 [Ginsengibacter sp.]